MASTAKGLSSPNKNFKDISPQEAFTLIELMIVIAVIAIILTLAIPTYTNFTVRAKIAEGLNVANAAKTAVASTCEENKTLVALTKSLAGYSFQPTHYVSDVDISGPCIAPVIKVYTQNTGAPLPDPVLTITGDFSEGSGRVTWTCVSSGLNIHVPDVCRS